MCGAHDHLAASLATLADNTKFEMPYAKLKSPKISAIDTAIGLQGLYIWAKALNMRHLFSPRVMIEKSASSRWAGWGSGLLDLNHTSFISFASVLQIAKFVPRLPQM